jgi:hypothetical protein
MDEAIKLSGNGRVTMDFREIDLESLAIFVRADLLAKRLEKFPELGNIIGNDSRSSEDSETSEASESSEDTESTESKESKDGSDDTEKSEDSETSENSEMSEDSEDSENSEASEDSESSEGSILKIIQQPFFDQLPVNIVVKNPIILDELLRRLELLGGKR